MVAGTAPSPVLRLDEIAHRAFLGDRELVRVTTALEEAGLIETAWFTEDSRTRGQYLHVAIALHHEHDLADHTIDVGLRPYWDGYLAFLAESEFQAASVEQAIYDECAGYAGRYDLFGQFPDLPDTALDLIDVKTGRAPAWTKLQTRAYGRRLNAPRLRRWALELPGDGRYRLVPLNLQTPITTPLQIDRQADQRHEAVFLAAITIANWKRGLIR